MEIDQGLKKTLRVRYLQIWFGVHLVTEMWLNQTLGDRYFAESVSGLSGIEPMINVEIIC